jgi:hypothetical protein
MSHHFDTDQAKADPRLNICDLYVFKGGGERTVLAMTCCADAGISSPDLFHPEGMPLRRGDIRGETADIEIRPLPLCSLPQSHGRQLRDEYLC